ncbi:hypothetical protein ANI_1_3080024 [Paecilomyces variotii No. 5]|uniref:Uncharacterized protein n=1 Tax=Byssochlamys spectabilis (strain No. 5 / NBRC 109023) TaxID=1356009 RepID=V5G4W3_BYSSN|nr:hypothetical protein ANI_1_3080024 [Paecilomyces variotii No. 5]
MSSPDSQETAVNGDNSPHSILWAYQMRRENTRLADKMDYLATLVSSTVEAAVAGRNSVEQLHTTAKDLLDDNRSLRERIASLERANIDVTVRMENLERDNERLHDVLDVMDRKWANRIKEEIAALQDMKKDVLTEVQEMLALQYSAMDLRFGAIDLRIETILDIVKAGHEKRCQAFQNSPISSPISCAVQARPPQDPGEDTTVLVPYSMPSTYSAPVAAEQAPGAVTEPSRSTHKDLEMSSIFQQKKRTLVEFLSSAEEARMQLPRREQESIAVEMFLAGLTDKKAKAALEKRMDDKGWTWQFLREACLQISIQQEPETRNEMVVSCDSKPVEMKQKMRDDESDL